MRERLIHDRRGFSLMETLIGTAVFVMIAVSIYQSYVALLGIVGATRVRTVASALANEQFEIAHNLPYSYVGTVGGIPSGWIPHTQTLVRDGITFQSTTTIRNVDDAFDGTIGGTPNDTSPADYKVMEVEIGCVTCNDFVPMIFTTNIAPKNLETASTNGALFVKVFDANGIPLSDARVRVINNTVTPTVNIDDVTNTQGMLQLVDVPPSASAYQVIVSKSGYSTDQTYQSGAVGNPNPTAPHLTVAVQQVTQASFAIDAVSTITFQSIDQSCTPVSNIPFTLVSNKIIGTVPTVYKYNANLTTNGSGVLTVSNLEWGNYMPTITSGSYSLAGVIAPLPITLQPGSTQTISFVLAPNDPNSLLVSVKDGASGLPLSAATTTITLNSFTQTLITGRGFLQQLDWSGGGGQASSTDQTKFLSADGNIDYTTTAGELVLKKILGNYQTPGELFSSAFDTGSPSNFYNILWNPIGQPVGTGVDSIKVQLATNNTGGPWNYLGPDGTNATYYTASNQNINAVHNGDRYVRYRVVLNTESPTYTPNLSDLAFTFSSSCVPPGQAFFSGLTSGTYTITVAKDGYQTYTDTVPVTASWQMLDVDLNPL